MGCAGSAPLEEAPVTHSVSAAQLATSREIDKALKADERKMAKDIKLLLLGAGESGKTTVLKQMKIIYATTFADEEEEQYRKQIFDNLCNGMAACLEAAEEWGIQLRIDPSSPHLELLSNQHEILNDAQPYPQEYLVALKTLWADEGIQQTMLRSNEASIPDNTTYFFNDLDRLFAFDYRPTHTDILHTRGKTLGITETTFQARDLTYRLFDVGVWRQLDSVLVQHTTERRKWLAAFENVQSVIFLAAISGYDQCLLEDKESNIMEESLMLFDTIANSKWFTKTSMMCGRSLSVGLGGKLICVQFISEQNRSAKIHKSPISRYFPEYTGSNSNANDGMEYFRKRFLSLNRAASRTIYVHFTCAVDTKAMRVVMAAVQDTILSHNLSAIDF